jgi:Flp pilus assembly protein TadD
MDLKSIASGGLGRGLAALAMLAALNGCASLKAMTADFNRKWDEPKSILAEMDRTADDTRAADSSAAQMAAINGGDCIRRFKLLETSDKDVETLAERRLSAGECLLEAGDNDGAARIFRLAAEDQPNALALQGEGIALVRLARFAEASPALRAALDLDPGLWRAWNALGVVKDQEGALDEAWEAFRRAAELNPQDGAALNNLGVSLLKAARHDEAIAAFAESLARPGAKEAADANIRLAHAMKGDYSAAVKALPEDRRPVALNNAGVAAASRGDETEARRLFMKALEESPHFYAKAYSNLSLLVQ